MAKRIEPTERNNGNEPVWHLPLGEVKAIRMDNSMAMTMHVGNISTAGGRRSAEISMAIGGFVFILAVKRGKSDKSPKRYALDLRNLIEGFFETEPRLHAEKLPRPRKASR
jgi:hypothetical protein